jgi:glycosyltransferase involved in cell wall biosynthesis
MNGDLEAARAKLQADGGKSSRLADEVAVMVGRTDLLTADAAVSTRARAAWAMGDLSGALQTLEDGGVGRSPYAERLRSELRLLEPGYLLPVPWQASRPVREIPDQSESIRVLHLLTNSLPHTQSGYSLRSHRILTALKEAGVQPVALTRTGYPVMVGKVAANDVDVVDGIPYHRTLPHDLGGTPEERLTQEVAQALELVEEFRPHILHTTTDYRNALVTQAVARVTGLPWIFEVRGLMEQTWIASQADENSRTRAADSEKARLVSAREAELAEAASAVVTLSETMADELSQRGVTRARVTIVPNGVESGLLDRNLSPAEARKQLGLDTPPEVFVVGATSALVDYEGFDVLIRALAEVRSNTALPDEVRGRLVVLLAGEGSAAPGLRLLAKQLDVAEQVIMPGRVSRNDAPVWIQAMNAVVVPRRDREVTRLVTPQKPIEALALGRPVIASDLEAIRETVQGAEGTGQVRLVPPDDPRALANALIEGVHVWSRLSRTSAESLRAVARSRTWTTQADRYEELYWRIGMAHSPTLEKEARHA